MKYAMDLFEYEFKLQNIDILKNRHKLGNLWAVVEEYFLPISFISEKGSFLVKIKEENQLLKDIWLLVIPKNIYLTISFLKQDLCYEDFLKNSNLYLVIWDLENNILSIEREVSFKDLKLINNKIENLLKSKLVILDRTKVDIIIQYLLNLNKLYNHQFNHDKQYQYNQLKSVYNYKMLKRKSFSKKEIQNIKDITFLDLAA